jgi:uncharacterized membrane protein YhhN
MTSRPLLFVSVSASLIFLVAGDVVPGGWPVFFKVASIALLALMAFRTSRLLGLALILGAIGDFFLDIRHLGNLGPEQLFLFGLVAFLAGHLVYIVLFLRFRAPAWKHSPPREIAVVSILLVLGVLLMMLQASLGPLLVPVILYALTLAVMAISAQFAELGNPLAAIGALCFVASDSILAISKFRAPLPASGPLIWITYYAAQFLIFLGISRATLLSRRA